MYKEEDRQVKWLGKFYRGIRLFVLLFLSISLVYIRTRLGY